MAIPPRFKHQEESYQRGLKMDRMFDTSDPGTGKTRVQLDIFQHYRHFNQGKCALVIAPKSLLYPAWVEDSKQFTPDLRLSVATAPDRNKGFNVQADMYVTNSDAATWLANQSSSFFERFDSLIIDEITYFKNPTSARSKAMASIAKYFRRRSGLTGTPSPNHITDLWHQVYLLDDGERLGDKYWAFRSVTCTPQNMHIPSQPHLNKWIPKPGVELQIAQLISDINVRHKFEDCVDIPPTHITHIRYDLSSKAQKEYDTLKRTAVLDMEAGVVLGLNKAALMGKLFQACSGSIYTYNGSIGVLDTQRTDILLDLARDREHSVIFYQWEHQRDYIVKRLKAANLPVCLFTGTAAHRNELINRFQAGLYRVFLVHPQSGAYGVTLTRANSWIWGSLTWNLEHYIQGNKRVARTGQTKKTEQIIITANGTVEEDVLKRLASKDASQNSILNILEQLK